MKQLGSNYMFIVLLFVVGSSMGQNIIGSKNDFDSSITDFIWCDDGNKILLVQTSDNSVYRSEDNGENFNKITKSTIKKSERTAENLQEIGEVIKVIKSSADGKTLIFIGSKDIIWVSTNCGKTMNALNREFNIARISTHPTESK